jgi:hypothetical protein
LSHCLAVWLAYAGRSVTDEILALILPVSAFIAAGFEHCVRSGQNEPAAELLRQTSRPIAKAAAVVIRKIPNTWYVSICVPHQEKTGYYYSRHSRTFASESEAKQFAAAKIAAGVEVTAGTLNPVAPKRVVGPSEIEEWLSEEPAKSASGACRRV